MSVALSPATAQTLIDQAAGSTMSGLFANQARSQADAIAIDDGHRQFTYCILDQRVNRLAALLRTHGVTRGERVAVLCENRIEYLEIMLGAARIGAIVACQNWRLAASELKTCLQLADPRLVITSARHRQLLAQAQVTLPIITFEDEYETLLAQSALTPITECAGLEDPLLMLYTSGTTGLPKAALISHRAEIARNLVVCAEFGVTPQDTFVAWSPLYHMGAAEISLGTLMNGGKIMVVDGFDVTRLATLVGEESLGWLLIMPGMVEAFADELESRAIHPCGVKLCGVMADLVPRHLIARITRLVDAPFANTFGATETGCPPCSSNRIAIGVVPQRLSKTQSPFCEVRLVDANDVDVAHGMPGELAMRGPTLFSGYWRNEQTNRQDFRGGWFHMGDVFVRNADGTLDFVDRVKYLIKSGGENIYPAEIERVLLAFAGVADAAVVRQRDPRWGEVPVAFVARHDVSVSAASLFARCRDALAGFKQPRGIHFTEINEFPRSASGKTQRHELELRLAKYQLEVSS